MYSVPPAPAGWDFPTNLQGVFALQGDGRGNDRLPLISLASYGPPAHTPGPLEVGVSEPVVRALIPRGGGLLAYTFLLWAGARCHVFFDDTVYPRRFDCSLHLWGRQIGRRRRFHFVRPFGLEDQHKWVEDGPGPPGREGVSLVRVIDGGGDTVDLDGDTIYLSTPCASLATAM